MSATIKHKLTLLALSFLALWACQKAELPKDVASTRTGELLTDYEAILGASTHGWKMYLFPDIHKFPGNMGGFSLFMKFDPSTGRVNMVSDFNEETRTTIHESAYQMKFTSLTTLSFDTYSPLSVLADPLPEISNAEETGPGNRVDLEYSILRQSEAGDTLFLRGNLHHCAGYLIKAKADEEAYFFGERQYGQVVDDFRAAAAGKAGLHLELPSSAQVVMVFDLAKRKLVLAQDTGGDSLQIVRTGFAYSGERTITLHQPYESEGLAISQIQISDGGLVGIAGSASVPVVDLGVPRISAYKMVANGAFSTIRIYADEQKRMHWPHNSEVSGFMFQSKGFGLRNAESTGRLQFGDYEWTFNASGKRMMFTVPFRIRDDDALEADGITPLLATEEELENEKYWNKGTAPYGYRYVVAGDEQLRFYYEGPQFIYAVQLSILNSMFKSSITDNPCRLDYSQSPSELLITLRNATTGAVIIEGAVY